jgi:hypothetical protein
LRVESGLRGQTGDIRAGLLVIRFQYIGLLLGGGKLCLQLETLY